MLDVLDVIKLNAGEHVALAISMIKTKLSFVTRWCILETKNTIQDIIDRLKGEVKQKDKSANKYVKEIEELKIVQKKIIFVHRKSILYKK